VRTIERAAVVNAAEVGDLQQALDSLPKAGGAVYIPAGKYEIDEPVAVSLADKQHLHLYGDGRATVLNFTVADGSHFLTLQGVENSWWPDLKITIRDLTLVGNYDCGDALHLLWPNDAMVDGCFFYGFGGVAVYVGPNATNVTVRDCWMRDCNRALHADNLHHLTFHGNQTRSAPEGQQQREHVYIGRHCREVRIVNSHLAYGHAEGVILDGTAQHVIANNTIEGFAEGIRAVDCRDIIINNNYLHCATGVLMEGDNRGLTVSGNVMTDNWNGAVVIREARGSGAHVISGNVVRLSVYDNGQRGVDLGDATDCVVSGNVFEDLTAGPAVAGAPDLSGHTVTDNRVTDTAARTIAADRPEAPLAANPRSRYHPLFEHFSNLPPGKRRITLTLGQIASAVGGRLPDAAWNRSAWWDNDPDSPQARAWMAAGWLAAIVKRIEGRIVFVRCP